MVIEKKRMAQLAGRYGLEQVVRWKPKKVYLFLESTHPTQRQTDLITGHKCSRFGAGFSVLTGTICYCWSGCVAERRGSCE